MKILDTYTIRKGCHYSGFRFRPMLTGKSIVVAFEFTDDSKYISHPYTQLREQWSKLGGLRYDLLGKYSNRIGWRYNCATDTFQICRYFHMNGVIVVRDIETVPQDTYISREISSGTGSICYRQYPYFGGKAAAPNKISINFKFL